MRIATAIDAVTVGEGIEDLEDLMPLRELDVRFGQGYYLARPDFCFPKVSDTATSAIRSKPQRPRLRPFCTDTSNLLSVSGAAFGSDFDTDDPTGPVLLQRYLQ
ncbi:MAG: EAL domain-containing protein [Myxococcales bacterium]|nr:EAL domain-containing protein [Myxococcales bacterium]